MNFNPKPMKRVIIKIEISPLAHNNQIELSKANQIGNDMIHKITNLLNEVDTSKFYFDVKITAE